MIPPDVAYVLAGLRRGVGVEAGSPACSACRTAISANITGLCPSAAAISISAAIRHPTSSCTALGDAIA